MVGLQCFMIGFATWGKYTRHGAHGI
jgi:hypothetical protein